MNLISFFNFTQSDNQTSLLPSTEKDVKPGDFSSILNSIFVALQTANLPVTNFSSGFEQNTFQVNTVSESGQNLSNNQILPVKSFSQNPLLSENLISLSLNQTILPTSPNSEEIIPVSSFKTESAISFSPTENLLSIPTNFQPAPKLPTMRNFEVENPIIETSPKVPQTVSANNQTLRVEPSVKTKDFEILFDSEQTNLLPPQNFSDFPALKSQPNTNLPRVFQNVSNSIRENHLPKEDSLETVLPESNFAETEINPTAIPIVKTEINPTETKPGNSSILKAEITYEVVKTQIEEPAKEVTVLPLKPSGETLEIKLPINFDLKPDVKPIVNSILESSVKLELPEQQNKINFNETLDFPFIKPNLAEFEVQSAVDLEINLESNLQPEVVSETKITETKSPINFDSKSEINVIPETKIIETKSPINFDLKLETNVISGPQINEAKSLVDLEVKTDFVLEAQSNLEFKNAPNLDISTPSHIPTEFVENLNISSTTEPIFSGIAAETKPTSLVFQNADLQFAETKPSQPILLKVDSQVVETTQVKPQVANAFIDEIIQPKVKQTPPNKPLQPKVENTFIEETPKPDLAQTPKPILTDEDFINVKLPFEDSSAPVLVENRPHKLNSTADKIIQSDLVEKPINVSSEESIKPNLAANKSTEVKPHIDAPPVFENINLAETEVVKPNLANYLNDGETIEKNPIQPNVLPENQKLTQSPNLISNKTTQTENTIKIADLGTPQNFNFSEKPEKEIKPKEIENNLPVNFDKIIENAVKDSKIVETNLKTQAEPAKIIEQINPHLLELAALTEKTNEKEILKLRLHPAELGTVEITLERNNSGVLNAHFKTETEGAQQILSNTLEQLRDNLQNAGWEVGQLEITNGSSSSTTNQDRENTQRKSEWIENFVFSRSSEKPDEAENSSPKRLLNLLA